MDKIEKAIIVGANIDQYERFEKSMDELENLVLACDIEVVGRETQNLLEVNNAMYIGKGKAEDPSPEDLGLGGGHHRSGGHRAGHPHVHFRARPRGRTEHVQHPAGRRNRAGHEDVLLDAEPPAGRRGDLPLSWPRERAGVRPHQFQRVHQAGHFHHFRQARGRRAGGLPANFRRPSVRERRAGGRPGIHGQRAFGLRPGPPG